MALSYAYSAIDNHNIHGIMPLYFSSPQNCTYL
jgi:hypothetical protein